MTDELKTGWQAGLSGDAQLLIGLRALFQQPEHRGTIKLIRNAVEAEMNGFRLSQQGKQTLASVFSREAVRRDLVLPFKESKPYWQLTKAGETFVETHIGEGGAGLDDPEQLGFDPEEFGDERVWLTKEAPLRPGQKEFRDAIVARYGGRCLVSGCRVERLLQAAHIFPFRGEKTDHPLNGLLLRVDLHLLFDEGMLRVDPVDLRIDVAPALDGSEYERFRGERLLCHDNPRIRPSAKALDWRWNWALSKDELAPELMSD